MSVESWSPNGRAGGFTLIEVLGALVIFSVGVLMVLQLSTALGTQMTYAGVRSELVVLANERLDSLEALPLDSLTSGTTWDTLTVGGMSYERTVTITSLTPVLARIDILLQRVDTGGPAYGVTSYASAAW